MFMNDCYAHNAGSLMVPALVANTLTNDRSLAEIPQLSIPWVRLPAVPISLHDQFSGNPPERELKEINS